MNYALQILTVCQAVWVLTLMCFLMFHYAVRSIKNRLLEKNAISIGISYCLLTVGTMISSLNGLYQWNTLWQGLVIVGYALGDYAIVRMLFHVQRNRVQKKILEDYIKNNKHKN